MFNFSSETMEVRKQWNSIFKVLKEKYQPRISYPTKLSYKNEGKLKIFTDKD